MLRLHLNDKLLAQLMRVEGGFLTSCAKALPDESRVQNFIFSKVMAEVITIDQPLKFTIELMQHEEVFVIHPCPIKGAEKNILVVEDEGFDLTEIHEDSIYKGVGELIEQIFLKHVIGNI